MADAKTGIKYFKLITVALILFTGSCMCWPYGWDIIEKAVVKGNVDELIARANIQINQADNKEKLAKLIDTYESILKIDSENYEALWSLGRYCSLMAWAYTDNMEEKKKYYVKAIQYTEQGIYTDPGFKALIDQGKKSLYAIRALSADKIEALFYWFVSVTRYWQCMSMVGRLINISWILNAEKVVNRIYELDPKWGGGHGYYTVALYSAYMPGFLGGDMEKAKVYVEKAIKEGPNWLYIKFGRACSIHVKNKDREGFIKDLEWVITQDPHKMDSPYPADVVFQRKAREMLANTDNYF